MAFAEPVAYSAEIAPVGHAASHVPHSRQTSGSITYLPSPSEIASAGHSLAHVPQATHSSEITYAMIRSSFFDIFKTVKISSRNLCFILIQNSKIDKPNLISNVFFWKDK